ncbi:MFS transporter [Natrialbaceae archaeon AArc-T1-2]|uniref:MFS transporter n=1 Tax=Natrialbaceae archaeon AArc-T1-2 TaxID=3053904 RepID=UPI00255AC79E|nr:MFS transporter [Natrialbaceae archaeon AArc-T1-2]WIV67788.1 MFS transporter [Natrialbaceae archaeon AArc-T1-2]
MRAILQEYAEIKNLRNSGLIGFSHGINEFYGLALPPVIPLLVADLDITYAQAGLLLTVFYAMYSIFQLPAGLVADYVGKKRLLVWGLLGMAAGLVLASTAQSYELLLVSQAVMGVCGSTYHPTGMAMISDTETKDTEGKAMGLFGLGGMLGIASAPLVIGGIAAVVDWRTALLAAAVLGVFVTGLFQLLYRTPTSEPPKPNGGSLAEPSDRRETERPDGGEPDVRTDKNVRPGVTTRVRRGLQRAVRFEITPGLVLISLITLLVSLQIRSIQTFTTGFLTDGTGQTASVANGIFFVMLSASAISSIWVGSLADRFDRGRLGAVAAITTSLLLLSTVLVVALDAAAIDWLATGGLVVVFGLLGLAVYGCTPIKNALISEYATTDSSGSIFGVTQTGSSIGSAAGPAIFGYVATEFSIAVAFPLIAVVGGIIAAGFYALSSKNE